MTIADVVNLIDIKLGRPATAEELLLIAEMFKQAPAGVDEVHKALDTFVAKVR